MNHPIRATHYFVFEEISPVQIRSWPNDQWAVAARYAVQRNEHLYRGSREGRAQGLLINERVRRRSSSDC